MFYAIIKIKLNSDIIKFEEITSQSINQCTCIAMVNSLEKLRKIALELIPIESSTFIACVTENKKSPLHIIKYTDANNLLGDNEFEWIYCTEEFIIPVKSPSIKEEIYTKTHLALNKAAATFYGKSSKNHLAEHIDKQALKPCLETERDFCLGDIYYDGVIYSHQRRITDCADTAMEMLKGYHLWKCNEQNYTDFLEQRQELKRNYENRKIKLFSGKNSSDLKSYSDFLNSVNVKDFIKDVLPGHLTYYLYRYGPVIARTNEIGGHFLLLKGVIDNQVIIDDPWAGSNIFIEFNEFNKKWDGRVIYFSAGYSMYIEQRIKQGSQINPSI